MNINTIISTLAGVVFLACQCVAESGREKTTNVVVEAQTVSEMARTMSRAQSYGLPICMEDGGSPVHRLSFALTNATIETVMRNIKSAVTNCDWSYDEKANVVNIFPKDSMLGWTIERIDIDAMSLEDVLLRSDPLKLQEHGITFFPGRGNLKWLKTPITLKAERLSAMQAVNMICCQLPFKARWELRRGAHRDKKTGVLSIQGCY
jgi:hypothetical protein